MAYFSSSSEGADYEEQWCVKCVHYGDDGCGCPILNLHTRHNYDEVEKKYSFLHVLIPIDEITRENKQCTMFYSIKQEAEIKDTSCAACIHHPYTDRCFSLYKSDCLNFTPKPDKEQAKMQEGEK